MIPARSALARRIDDYALIGDCETAALVNRSGTIEWLTWPRFDSQACFAALLGGPEHGCWSLAPKQPVTRTSRRYRPGTLILETRVETEGGAAVVIDFMPLRGTASDLVRIVVGERGKVAFESELALRFDYGRISPWIESEESRIVALAGPHGVCLETDAASLGCDEGVCRHGFEVAAGERMAFAMTYFPSHQPRPERIDAEEALQDTERFWTDWSSKSQAEGPWAEAIERSLITLKALTYRPTGGVLAAATTSLPERWEGERNWDYRFCWLRDATFTLLTLLDAGYRREAEAWRDWLLRAIAGEPDKLQPVYGVAGEHRLTESILDWLPGFEGAGPVRIGNQAFCQHQLDVYGEVLDALHQARLVDIEEEPSSWRLQCQLLEHLEGRWREPDEGIWETRAGPERFTHSQVMAWVGFDRAVKAVERCGLEGPVERWRALRAEVHEEVCRKGFDPELNAFTRSFGSKSLDASTLLIPLVGFLPPEDPRVAGTVEAIQKNLTQDGLVLRYDTRENSDGLPPGEGAFLACSFWLVDNLVLLNRYDEAEALFERLISIRNDLGLLSEEYDPVKGCMLGNFPQALSHVALVDSAYNLMRARGPARERGAA